jgi:hypothetical protein
VDNYNQIGTNHRCIKGYKVCSNEGSGYLKRGDNEKKKEQIGWIAIKIF